MRFLPSLLVPVLVCLGAVAPGADAALRVVTGNTVCHDLVQRIGGPAVTATCLLAPGIDPHTYQPVPADAKALAEARLVVINGLGFEGWFEGLAKEAAFQGTVLVASATITPLVMPEEDEEHEEPTANEPANAAQKHHDHHDHHDHHEHHHHGSQDPHAWNSPRRGVAYVEAIRDGLIAADPAGADGYRTRAAALMADLRAVDAEARTAFARIPPAARKLVTNHDALQYFAVDYGFEVKAVATALEDSQPGAKDLAELVGFIRRQGVRGVFLEFGKNGKVVAQVAQEAGVRLSDPLYLDGLDAPGTPAGSYVGMLRHNLAAIAKALE